MAGIFLSMFMELFGSFEYAGYFHDFSYDELSSDDVNQSKDIERLMN